MERPPFSLPGAKSVIFIYPSHETIMFMEYQMGANAAVLIRACGTCVCVCVCVYVCVCGAGWGGTGQVLRRHPLIQTVTL